jgi:hypothetical protein
MGDDKSTKWIISVETKNWELLPNGACKKTAAKRQQRQLLKLVGVEIAEVAGHCSQCSSFLVVMVDDDER